MRKYQLATVHHFRSSSVAQLSDMSLTAIRAAYAGENADDPSLTIAVANGCFDLLGRHHLFLLSHAATYADRLIVVVNSDVSVRALKGLDRPIVKQEDRVALLRLLSFVDSVVVLHAETPYDLLRALRPHVLVKGDVPDQTTDGEQYAERVVRIPLYKSASTTETVERIRKGKP